MESGPKRLKLKLHKKKHPAANRSGQKADMLRKHAQNPLICSSDTKDEPPLVLWEKGMSGVNTEDIVISSMDGSQEMNMGDTDDVIFVSKEKAHGVTKFNSCAVKKKTSPRHFNGISLRHVTMVTMPLSNGLEHSIWSMTLCLF